MAMFNEAERFPNLSWYGLMQSPDLECLLESKLTTIGKVYNSKVWLIFHPRKKKMFQKFYSSVLVNSSLVTTKFIKKDIILGLNMHSENLLILNRAMS